MVCAGTLAGAAEPPSRPPTISPEACQPQGLPEFGSTLGKNTKGHPPAQNRPPAQVSALANRRQNRHQTPQRALGAAGVYSLRGL